MTSVKNPFGEVTYYEYRLDGQVSCRILGNGCVTYYVSGKRSQEQARFSFPLAA